MTAPRSSSPPILLAPGASSHTLYAPGRNAPLPSVDARLAAPEAGEEVVDGERIQVMGANPPHALSHSDAVLVLRGCLAPGYLCSVDMLTRLDEDNDRAPDVSVFPEQPYATTGERTLEEIVFEIRSTESLAHVTKKALAFVTRGVRRVFYLRLPDHTLFEWNHRTNTWKTLAGSEHIVDKCFRVPLPVSAFASSVAADSAVANALLKANNPTLVAALDLEKKQGEKKGLRDGARDRLVRILVRRGLAVDDAVRARIAACNDLATLERWLDQSIDAASLDKVFDEPV
jgi:hypothetical protein